MTLNQNFSFVVKKKVVTMNVCFWDGCYKLLSQKMHFYVLFFKELFTYSFFKSYLMILNLIK